MKNPSIIYLAINLPDSVERRQNIIRQGKNSNIDIQIVEAVSGKTLTPEQRSMYDEKKRESIYLSHLTPNEQACMHSHLKALQTLVDSDADYAVVMEDDAILEPNFKVGIDFLIESVPGWECCKLYTNGSKLYSLCPPIPNAPVQPIFPKKLPWGAIAYLYSRVGAEKILAHSETFFMAADLHLAEIMLKHNIPVIGVTPSIVTTLYAQNEQSDIDAGGQRYRTKTRPKRTAMQYILYRANVVTRAVNKWLMCRRMCRIFRKNKVGY